MYKFFLILAGQACASAAPAIDDPCVGVCELYSEARLGNGFNLCENGGSSECYPDAEMGEYFCRNLFWSVEGAQRGLVYESNVTTLTAEERSYALTCREATNIVREQGPRPTNNLNMALHMLVHSAPIQRRLTAIDNTTQNVWYRLNQFAHGDETISSELVERLSMDQLSSVGEIFSMITTDQSLIFSDDIVDSFGARLARRACVNCMMTAEPRHMLPACCAARESPISLVEAVQYYLFATMRVQCPRCHHRDVVSMPYSLNSPSEILTIGVTREDGAILSLPLILNLTDVVGPNNLTNTMYRLYGFASDNLAATFRFEGDWYTSHNGTFTTLIEPITESVITDSASLVLYERI